MDAPAKINWDPDGAHSPAHIQPPEQFIGSCWNAEVGASARKLWIPDVDALLAAGSDPLGGREYSSLPAVSCVLGPRRVAAGTSLEHWRPGEGNSPRNDVEDGSQG